MSQATDDRRLQQLLERTEIFDLVRVERFHRDQRDWDGLVGCYVKNAPVRTTWFEGTIEDFVEATYRRAQRPSVTPAEPLPVDWDVIKTLRPSYKFLAYTQLRRGYQVDPD